MDKLKAEILKKFTDGNVSILYICPVCDNKTSTIEPAVGEKEWTCGYCKTKYLVYWC